MNPQHKTYADAYEHARNQANELGHAVGIEKNSLFGFFHTFLLPSPQHRTGHELRCEVVEPGMPRTTPPEK